MQEELLAEYAEHEPGGEGFVHEEMGELLHAAGDANGARPYFAKAHEMLQEYNWVEADRMARLKELGGL